MTASQYVAAWLSSVGVDGAGVAYQVLPAVLLSAGAVRLIALLLNPPQRG